MTELTIIIPCRNEEGYIGACIESVLAQDYPRDQMEIIVADGMSEDKTAEIVRRYAREYPCVRLIDNPGKIVPTGLNACISQARGDIIMRLDAHNSYPSNYASLSVRHLKEENVDNVGGLWEVVPGGNGVLGEPIVSAFTSRFGAGNAHYKTGTDKARLVDTVPFGCYRREVFERIGLFDEDLVRNQDDEFNLRLRESGGRILLCPDISSRYHARDSLRKLSKMYFQYGYFKPLVALKVGAIGTLRQLAPALLVLAVILGAVAAAVFEPVRPAFAGMLLAYLLACLAFSVAARPGRISSVIMMPTIFAVIHFSYGLGYLKGIGDFVIRKRQKTNMQSASFPLSR
jgi:glycosyltransferase involved in cell wall biosynthesis